MEGFTLRDLLVMNLERGREAARIEAEQRKARK